MFDRLKQALGLEPVNPDLIIREEMPLTARMIQELFDRLPDEIQLVEEEE